MLIRFLQLASFLFGLCPPAEAIVNIETLRAQKGTGTQHISELKANGADGNSENFRAGVGHVTAWKWESRQIFLVLDYTYGESREIKDTNKFFSHLRLAQQLQRTTSQWETFLQWQYNEFQRLNSRSLAGMGWRETLFSADTFSLHAGLGGFWYTEEISTKGALTSESEEGGRFNTYLALQWRLDKMLYLFNTVYFQPHMEYLKDHLVLWDFQFEFKSSDWLAMTLNWTVAHDNNPPEGIKTTDSTYKAGLKFSY